MIGNSPILHILFRKDGEIQEINLHENKDVTCMGVQKYLLQAFITEMTCYEQTMYKASTAKL